MSKTQQPTVPPREEFRVQRRGQGPPSYDVVLCASGEELWAEWWRSDKRYSGAEICKLLNWAFARGWRARTNPHREDSEFCAVEAR
jgi:hypothetical protein